MNKYIVDKILLLSILFAACKPLPGSVKLPPATTTPLPPPSLVPSSKVDAPDWDLGEPYSFVAAETVKGKSEAQILEFLLKQWLDHYMSETVEDRERILAYRIDEIKFTGCFTAKYSVRPAFENSVWKSPYYWGAWDPEKESPNEWYPHGAFFMLETKRGGTFYILKGPGSGC